MEILPRSVCTVRQKLASAPALSFASKKIVPFHLPLYRNLHLVFGFGFEVVSQSVMATISEDSDA